MKKTVIASVAAFGLLSFSASAAESGKTDKSFLNSEIFSLAKKKENSFDAASSVYVLSSEDIRRSGVTSIPEALRLVPGIQVAKAAGNTWAISARGLNHQYASKLLVMVDGVTVYTPIFSGTFWDNQDYVIGDIDRIEVIRGPGGSIWGANAMNGIINIITKSSAQTQGTYVSQIIGNSDKSITEARYGGKLKNVDTYRVFAKRASRGGNQKLFDNKTNVDFTVNNSEGSNNDGLVSDRVGFKYDIASIKDNSVSISGQTFNSVARNYFQGLGNAQGGDKVNTGGVLSLTWNKTFSSKSSTALQTYFNYDRNNIQVVDFHEKTFDIDFQHFYNFSERNQFIWGLGYKSVLDKVASASIDAAYSGGSYTPLEYNPGKRNIETYSAFIQDKIGIIANELYLTLGSKFQINDQTGFEYQPNARLTYFPARNQTLWAAVSRAVRIPTLGEDGIEIRYDNPLTSEIETVTRGRPTALSETVLAYEVGYRIKPTYDTSIDISTYYNQYSHLGTFDADENNIPTASNTGYAKTYGLELTGKWQVMAPWRLELGYDFLNSDVRVNAASNENDPSVSYNNVDKLSYFQNMSPRNQIRLRSLLNVGSKSEFDNMFYYVDSLPGRDNGYNGESGVPAYVRWDSRFGYLATKNLDLSVGIQNILNNKHQEFGAGLFNNKTTVGRSYYLKATLQF